jgi:ribose transport system substrate-binding protein
MTFPRSRVRPLLGAAALSALLPLGCTRPAEKAPEGGAAKPAAKALRIAVIPKGTTHEFWNAIHAGARRAEQELNAAGTPVEVIWKGPLREDDREQQIQVVEGFASQGVSGLVLAPLDSRALVRPVEEAKKLGLPTVIIDSGLESDQIVSFVATDNRKGGELAGAEMAKRLGGQGRVLLLRYQEGSASTMEREEGFLAGLKAAGPGIQVLSSDQYAGATRDTAKRASENLLNRFGAQADGVFTPNESSTSGMLLALQDAQRAGKLVFLGFDSSPAFLEAMKAKQLHGIVVQDPLKMGYLGVKTMVDQLQGRAVEKRVDTGVAIVTPETMDDPAMKDLLRPPIERYLKS